MIFDKARSFAKEFEDAIEFSATAEKPNGAEGDHLMISMEKALQQSEESDKAEESDTIDGNGQEIMEEKELNGESVVAGGGEGEGVGGQSGADGVGGEEKKL